MWRKHEAQRCTLWVSGDNKKSVKRPAVYKAALLLHVSVVWKVGRRPTCSHTPPRPCFPPYIPPHASLPSVASLRCFYINFKSKNVYTNSHCNQMTSTRETSSRMLHTRIHAQKKQNNYRHVVIKVNIDQHGIHTHYMHFSFDCLHMHKYTARVHTHTHSQKRRKIHTDTVAMFVYLLTPTSLWLVSQYM